MSPAKRESRRPTASSPQSAAQQRVAAAAQKLFARHGVGGTSLQMIADELGVTKAAVYHQYHTKEEIVRAVALSEIEHVEAVLAAAEAEPTRARAREAAITGVIDLAISRRRQVATLLTDPVIGGLFARDKRLLGVLDRLNGLLMGADAGPDSQVATAMLIAAISGATIHPLVVGRDDDALRTQLLRLTHRFLGLRS